MHLIKLNNPNPYLISKIKEALPAESRGDGVHTYWICEEVPTSIRALAHNYPEIRFAFWFEKSH